MAQIVGQEPVVRTLGRAIDTGRVAHAYLFSGPRGTGKTSTAKVLAMGLNCRNADVPTSEPCGECDSCRAISNNSSLDVLEMDAASNRKIDEIREMLDGVNLAPSSGRYKVYIVDEVHMLTPESFNALLKTLEEPPERVIFVLATTEKHKVLPTIISRCQSFDFKRPGVQTLADKLSEISAAEGIDAEPEALTVIARAGGGSFRDAEGLLDQLASFSEGRITATMVRDLLGSAGTAVLAEATEALHERRTADALRLIDRISNEGRDLGQFTGELLEHLRRVMLFPHAPEVALAEVGEAGEERDRLQYQAGTIPTAEVVRFVDTLGDSLGRAKRGGDPKLELELTFLRLTRDYSEPSVEALIARIEALEDALADGSFTDGATLSPSTPPSYSSPETAPPEPDVPDLEEVAPDVDTMEEQEDSGASGPASPRHTTQDDTVPAEPETAEPESVGGSERVAAQWKSMMQELKRNRQALTAAVYEEARVAEFDGSVLKLSFPEEQSFYVGMANDRKHADALGEILEERLGSRPRLEIAVHDGTEPPFASGGAGSTATPAPDTVPEDPNSNNPSMESSGPEAEPAPKKSAAEEPPEEEPPEEDTARGAHEGPQSVGENGHRATQAPSEAPGREPADDIIRDPREVVELARQRFGNSGGNGRDTSGRGGGS
jgi:DNA polymerase-3 subunit gamma/tau